MRRTVRASPPTAATTLSQKMRPTRLHRPATTWLSPGAGRRAWPTPPRIPAAGRSGRQVGRRVPARLKPAGVLPGLLHQAAPRSRSLRVTLTRRARRPSGRTCPSCKARGPPTPSGPQMVPHHSWEWNDSPSCPPTSTQTKASRAKCPESIFHEVSSVPFSCWGVRERERERRAGAGRLAQCHSLPSPCERRSTHTSSALNTHRSLMSAWVLCFPKMTF